MRWVLAARLSRPLCALCRPSKGCPSTGRIGLGEGPVRAVSGGRFAFRLLSGRAGCNFGCLAVAVGACCLFLVGKNPHARMPHEYTPQEEMGTQNTAPSFQHAPGPLSHTIPTQRANGVQRQKPTKKQF